MCLREKRMESNLHKDTVFLQKIIIIFVAHSVTFQILAGHLQ